MELELHQIELKYATLRILDPGRQARLTAALLEQGQRAPVLVVPGIEGRYVLIDGYRRVVAIKALGRDTVEALVLPLGEVEALVYGHRQERWQKRSALEDGWLVQELMGQHGLSLGAVADQLGRSKSWVSRRLGLVEVLPEKVQELVRTGKICPHAAMKYLVPLARANAVSCGKLAEGISSGRLSSRQVGEIYLAWKLADDEERARIEAQPLLYLKAAAVLEQEPEDPGVLQLKALLMDLDGISGLCFRARRKAQERALFKTVLARKQVERAWRRARQAVEALDETIEEVLHAGSGHANGGAAAAR